MTKEITQDLRSQLASIEERQAILLSQREAHSYDAIVTKDKIAVERVAAINLELDGLKHQEAGLAAALREAAKREIAAAEAERDDKRKANAAKAQDVLLHCEDTAALLTKAMSDLRQHSITLQTQFAEIRRLTGTGPTDEMLRVHLSRALRAGTMGSPIQIQHLAPNERVLVDAVITPWVQSIRNWINAAIGTKPARKAA
jgi:hypothetical protein